jgi:uncharacterized protein (DUF2141 family)
MRPFLMIFLVFTAGRSTPALSQTYAIRVIIADLRSDKGKVYLSIYNSEKGYPKEASVAYRLSFSDIHNGQSTITLAGMPPGTYAIACYHDENDNGKLDANFLGIPKEGTGASNNARGSLGPPKFRDAKFQLASDTTLSIKINY